MGRYRRKSVMIDAVQWTGINVDEVVTWAGEMALKHKQEEVPGKITVEEIQKINFDLTAKPHIKMTIVTIQGEMAVQHGEYVVCTPKGFDFCAASVIEKDYDKVHPDYNEPDGPAVTFQTCKGCGHFIDSCECSWSFDHKKADRLIMEARSREYSKHELELADMLEGAKGLDEERRAFYDNFKLVQDDRHKKIDEIRELKAALSKLVPTLRAFRESDHSFDRAPTAEGQAVLDAWDETEKILSR
jgi:hypothetical protein